MIDWCKPLLKRCRALPLWLNGTLIWRPGDMWGALRESYEPEVARYMRSVLASSDGMVDIGAHQGNWTVWAARQFPHLKIVAVEPGRVNAGLRRMLQLNRVAHRVLVLESCVSGGRETVTYWDNGRTTSAISKDQAATRCPADVLELMTERRVEAVTLGDVVETARRFCGGERLLVKCDVEGHETEIFADDASLHDPQLNFVVELHNVPSPDDSIVVTRARAAGRTVSTLGQFWGGTVTVALSATSESERQAQQVPLRS